MDRFGKMAVHVVGHVLERAKSQSSIWAVRFGDKAVYKSSMLRISIVYTLHSPQTQTTKQQQDEEEVQNSSIAAV